MGGCFFAPDRRATPKTERGDRDRGRGREKEKLKKKIKALHQQKKKPYPPSVARQSVTPPEFQRLHGPANNANAGVTLRVFWKGKPTRKKIKKKKESLIMRETR
jgi:hypothetical protein